MTRGNYGEKLEERIIVVPVFATTAKPSNCQKICHLVIVLFNKSMHVVTRRSQLAGRLWPDMYPRSKSQSFNDDYRATRHNSQRPVTRPRLEWTTRPALTRHVGTGSTNAFAALQLTRRISAKQGEQGESQLRPPEDRPNFPPLHETVPPCENVVLIIIILRSVLVIVLIRPPVET